MTRISLDILRDPIRVFTGLCWASAIALTLLLSWMAVRSIEQVRSTEMYVEGLQRQAAKLELLSDT